MSCIVMIIEVFSIVQFVCMFVYIIIHCIIRITVT